MNEKLIYIDEIREKLGVSPKKYEYKIVNGEIVIYNLNYIENFSA